MDARVNANPAKLKEFARKLLQSADAYSQTGKQLRRQLQATGWDDKERQKFEADLDATLKAIEKFAEAIRAQHVPNLQRRASALEEYLRR